MIESKKRRKLKKGKIEGGKRVRKNGLERESGRNIDLVKKHRCLFNCRVLGGKGKKRA